MRFPAKKFLTLLLVALCAGALRAQTIQIKVVNGKNGRPVAGVCVGLWNRKDTQLPVYIPTDKDGIARVRLTQKDSDRDISYNPQLGCGGTGTINPVLKYDDTLAPYSTGEHPSCAFPESMPNARWKETDSIPTKEVLQKGYVSANTCGKATASPQPGMVILFVRARNFHEKVQDWKAGEYFPL